METEARGAMRPYMDLNDKFALIVGSLRVLSDNLAEGKPDPAADRIVIDDAMAFLAGLQAVVCFEPPNRNRSRSEVAANLRAMAAIGPRPPSASQAMIAAAGHLTIDDGAAKKADAAEAVPTSPSAFGSFMQAQLTQDLARMDCERAAARMEVASIRRRAAELASQSEPLASMGMAARDRLAAIVAAAWVAGGAHTPHYQDARRHFILATGGDL